MPLAVLIPDQGDKVKGRLSIHWSAMVDLPSHTITLERRDLAPVSRGTLLVSVVISQSKPLHFGSHSSSWIYFGGRPASGTWAKTQDTDIVLRLDRKKSLASLGWKRTGTGIRTRIKRISRYGLHAAGAAVRWLESRVEYVCMQMQMRIMATARRLPVGY